MSEAKKILHNTLYQTLGKSVAVCIALFGFGVMTRYLGSEGYGMYATAYAFLTVFSIVVDLGMQMTTTKLISDPRNDEREILSNALTIRFILSVLFLSLAPLVAFFFPYPAEIRFAIALGAFGFLWGSMVATITSFFQKHLVMHAAAFAEVAGKITFVLVLSLAVWQDWGLRGVVGAVAADGLVVFLVMLGYCSRRVIIRPSYNREIWTKIFSTTWPIGLTIALNLIYFKGDIFVMSLYREQGEVGIYAAPYRILEVLINLNYLVLGLALPLLAAAAAAKNSVRLKALTQTMFDITAVATIPVVVGAWFLGHDMLVFFAGNDFALSGELFKVLIVAAAAIYFAGMFGYVVVALDKQKEMIKYYGLNAAISIVLYFIFIPQYGAWAAAYLTVLTELFIMATAAFVASKHLQFFPRFTLMGKSLIASAVMAVGLWAVGSLHFLLQIILGGGLFVAMLFVLRAFTPSTILALLPLKR